MKSHKSKNKEVVYIILDGMEFKVSDKNGAALMLISATDRTVPKKERLNMLDIKGLGLLKYRTRKVVRRRNKGKLTKEYYIEYRLKFEQWTKF